MRRQTTADKISLHESDSPNLWLCSSMINVLSDTLLWANPDWQ